MTRRVTIACAVVAAVLLVPRAGEARTWYVRAGGTGDAPTIQAALDSSVAGDTVLVGPGTYETMAIAMKSGVVLRSEYGPYETRIVPEPNMYPWCAIGAGDVDEFTEISGFWIEGFIYGWTDTGAMVFWNCWDLHINNNVLTKNEWNGITIDHSYNSFIIIENNTLVDNGYLEIDGGGAYGYIGRNIIWGDADGIIQCFIECNCMLDPSDAGEDADGNWGLDPQFCGTVGSGNLFLQSDSPCLPGNAPPPMTDYCTLVGALPMGCAQTPTKRVTWGEIKSLYR
jgi:hypothetical protein